VARTATSRLRTGHRRCSQLWSLRRGNRPRRSDIAPARGGPEGATTTQLSRPTGPRAEYPCAGTSTMLSQSPGVLRVDGHDPAVRRPGGDCGPSATVTTRRIEPGLAVADQLTATGPFRKMKMAIDRTLPEQPRKARGRASPALLGSGLAPATSSWCSEITRPGVGTASLAHARASTNKDDSKQRRPVADHRAPAH